MGKGIVCFLAAFLFALVLQNALSLELDGFLVDTLDSTILALEKDRATKDLTKSVTVPRRKISYKKVTTGMPLLKSFVLSYFRYFQRQ